MNKLINEGDIAYYDSKFIKFIESLSINNVSYIEHQVWKKIKKDIYCSNACGIRHIVLKIGEFYYYFVIYACFHTYIVVKEEMERLMKTLYLLKNKY